MYHISEKTTHISKTCAQVSSRSSSLSGKNLSSFNHNNILTCLDELVSRGNAGNSGTNNAHIRFEILGQLLELRSIGVWLGMDPNRLCLARSVHELFRRRGWGYSSHRELLSVGRDGEKKPLGLLWTGWYLRVCRRGFTQSWSRCQIRSESRNTTSRTENWSW